MRLLATAALVSLTGCASMVGGNYAHLQGTPDYQQCNYQAQLATPPSNNVFIDVQRQMELTNMCLANKGYTSR